MRDYISSKLSKHHRTLEKSVECINFVSEFENNQKDQRLTFESRLNNIVAIDYQDINGELLESLECLN